MERVAVVTGGTGALGRWVVKELLDRGLRVHVPWIAESEAEELRSLLEGPAPPLVLTPANLGSAGEVERYFEHVRLEAGRLDVLCNLVGGFAAGGIEETEPFTWDHMMSLNATTAFLTCRSAVPLMRASGGGRIVNVASLKALDRASASLSAYAASKAAVVSLTGSLSEELRKSRITVNAIAPEIIDTPANRKAMPDANRSTWLDPREVAAVVGFLTSEAAACVTGAVIPLAKG